MVIFIRGLLIAVFGSLFMTVLYITIWGMCMTEKRRQALVKRAADMECTAKAKLKNKKQINPYNQYLCKYEYTWAGKTYTYTGRVSDPPEEIDVFFRVSPKHAAPWWDFGGVEDDWAFIAFLSFVIFFTAYYCVAVGLF